MLIPNSLNLNNVPIQSVMDVVVQPRSLNLNEFDTIRKISLQIYP